jgi:hypothetical protein
MDEVRNTIRRRAQALTLASPYGTWVRKQAPGAGATHTAYAWTSPAHTLYGISVPCCIRNYSRIEAARLYKGCVKKAFPFLHAKDVYALAVN